MESPYTTKSLAELEAIRTSLWRRLRRLGPELIAGTLTESGSRCGNPNCRCARGHKHPKLTLTYKAAGKTQSTYIPQDLAAEARRWNADYKQAKELLREIAAVTEAIVRGHAGRQRQAESAPVQLRLLEDEE